MDLSKVKKYEDLSFAQWMAFGNKAGGLENVIATLRDEKTLTVEGPILSLFDKNGRKIPHILTKLESSVKDANRDYYLYNPQLEYAEYIRFFEESLGIAIGITSKELKEEERLRSIISEIPEVKKILNGVCLPVILTKRHSDDLGKDLDWQLEGVRRSYCRIFNGKIFKKRVFRKYTETLADQVSIVDESGYQKIWDKKKEGNLIALFFPNPLQGYSVDAQREQMADISKFGFVLSGAIEPMVMYPDVLARDGKTPQSGFSRFRAAVHRLFALLRGRRRLARLWLRGRSDRCPWQLFWWSLIPRVVPEFDLWLLGSWTRNFGSGV